MYIGRGAKIHRPYKFFYARRERCRELYDCENFKSVERGARARLRIISLCVFVLTRCKMPPLRTYIYLIKITNSYMCSRGAAFSDGRGELSPFFFFNEKRVNVFR